MPQFQPSLFASLRRAFGCVTRTVFIGMSLLIGTALLIGWAIILGIMAACKSTWGRGWEFLFAITCTTSPTLQMQRRGNNSTFHISFGSVTGKVGVNGPSHRKRAG